MELSGRLVSFPINELLTWAVNDRRTGSLVLRRSSREKRIYFRDGEIVACLSDSTEEFYGQAGPSRSTALRRIRGVG